MIAEAGLSAVLTILGAMLIKMLHECLSHHTSLKWKNFKLRINQIVSRSNSTESTPNSPETAAQHQTDDPHVTPS